MGKQRRSKMSEKESNDSDDKYAWKRIEGKIDAMRASIENVNTSVAGIDTRLTALESKAERWQDLIQPRVVSEVKRATDGLRDDWSLTDRKVEDLTQRMAQFKSSELQQTVDEHSIIIRNMPIVDEDNNLMQDVLDLFGDTLQIDVGVKSVNRFDAHGKRIPLVKVELANLDDKVLVLKNKRKLLDTAETKSIHIEKCLTKLEAITRDNWNTIINALGPAGKSLRVVGTGRIVNKKKRGESQVTAEDEDDGDADDEEDSAGTSGSASEVPREDPMVQRSGRAYRTPSKHERRPSADGGTNTSNKSRKRPPSKPREAQLTHGGRDKQHHENRQDAQRHRGRKSGTGLPLKTPERAHPSAAGHEPDKELAHDRKPRQPQQQTKKKKKNKSRNRSPSPLVFEEDSDDAVITGVSELDSEVEYVLVRKSLGSGKKSSSAHKHPDKPYTRQHAKKSSQWQYRNK